MSINNMYNTLAAAYLNPLSSISSINPYGSMGNIYQTDMSFYSILKSKQANRMKQEIYNTFGIEVGGYSDTCSCYIPSEVLCRMYTDRTLKEKVFTMLEKYSGEEFKEKIMEHQSISNQSAMLLYRKLLMQQAALMPVQTNLYSGYNSLYGWNSTNSFNMLQNPFFSSLWG